MGFFFGTSCFAPDSQRKKYTAEKQAISLPAVSFASLLCRFRQRKEADL